MTLFPSARAERDAVRHARSVCQKANTALVELHGITSAHQYPGFRLKVAGKEFILWT